MGVREGVGDGVAVDVVVVVPVDVALGDAVVLGEAVDVLVALGVVVPVGSAVGGFAPSHVPPVLPKISATHATFVPALFTAFATPTQMTGGPTLEGTQTPWQDGHWALSEPSMSCKFASQWGQERIPT